MCGSGSLAILFFTFTLQIEYFLIPVDFLKLIDYIKYTDRI